MSEGLKELPVPFYLPSGQKSRSRALYEQAFPEDTEKFVDYYYSCRIKDNQILALEEDGQIVSMLHLNPYQMIVNGYETESNYIVAVATREDCRHRGYMRVLLEKALKDMAGQGMPFTFLMPASERIYAPFDFVWVCMHTELPGRVARMDMEAQNRYLAAHYQMFCKRNGRYMEDQRARRAAEEGEASPEKMPPYMVRITDVCQMLRTVRSQNFRELYLHVKDPVIEKNHGYFLWRMCEDSSTAERLAGVPERVDLELTVGEIASMIFKGMRICLSEVV